MGRLENITVFEDTQKQYNENKTLSDAVKNSIKNQKLILETDNIPQTEIQVYDTPAKVVVCLLVVLLQLGAEK